MRCCSREKIAAISFWCFLSNFFSVTIISMLPHLSLTRSFNKKKTTAINYNENLTKKNKKFTETRNIRRKLQIERIPCSSTRAAVLTTLLCLDGWGGSSTRSCFKLLRKRTANNTFQDLLLHKKSFLFFMKYNIYYSLYQLVGPKSKYRCLYVGWRRTRWCLLFKLRALENYNRVHGDLAWCCKNTTIEIL